MFEIKKINKTFKIIIKSGTLSLAARHVVFFGGVKKDWTRAATMLDETPGRGSYQSGGVLIVHILHMHQLPYFANIVCDTYFAYFDILILFSRDEEQDI